jgi:hypothetical protein
MSNYFRILAGVVAVSGILNWYASKEMLAAQGEGSETSDSAAWSQYGEAFQRGVGDYVDGKAIHERCMEEVNASGKDYSRGFGTSLPEADVYVVCYTREMQRNPSRLCSDSARTNFLWHIKHYAIALKWATGNYQAGLEKRPSNSSADIESGDAIAPRIDPFIVQGLDAFVRSGLVSRDKELAQLIDVSILSEKNSVAEFAAARREICQ